MLLGLALMNFFGIWERYLVGFSLGPLADLMLSTSKGSLVGLSLLITIGYPLESLNTGAYLPETLLGTPLALKFGSEAARCLCCCRRLMDFHEAT